MKTLISFVSREFFFGPQKVNFISNFSPAVRNRSMRGDAIVCGVFRYNKSIRLMAA